MNRAFSHPPSPPDLRGGESPGRDPNPQPHPARGSLSQSADPSSPAETEPRTADPSSPAVRGDYSIRFTADGEHEAMRAAEAWCKARGFSVGAMQADAPRGVMHGVMRIAKWRNLDGQDREDLHGVMEAPGRTWRTGPITITIRRDAPSAVREAFQSEPGDLDSTDIDTMSNYAEQKHVWAVEGADGELVAGYARQHEAIKTALFRRKDEAVSALRRAAIPGCRVVKVLVRYEEIP